MNGPPKKSILITDGAGFIGSALTKALTRLGHRVRSFDNHWLGKSSRLEDAAVEKVTGDIRDRQAIEQAIKGMDCVCHLAAVNGTRFFYEKPELVLEVSVRGMLNVLDACAAQGVKDFILVSSSEVYHLPPVTPTPETVPLVIPDVLNARYSYSAGNIISEMLALHGAKTLDRIRIVRPHNVFGPNMGWEHVIPQLILRIQEAARRGTRRLPIQGSGQETRAFVYIEDMVEGFLKVLERGEHRGIYHIGTPNEVSIHYLAGRIAALMKVKIEIVPGELTRGSPPRRCPDITKARRLGYEPKFSLDEGLKRTIEWYVEHATERPMAA